MSNLALPPGWIACTLPEIAIINPKSSLSDRLDVGFVPMALVPTGFHPEVKFEIRKWSEVKNGYTHFQDGDVIFAKITPCFENSKAAIISSLPNKTGCGSTEYFVIRPMICPPQFYYYFIKSQEFLKSGELVMTGSVGQKRVPSEYVKNRPVPLPPLAEQHRIVAKLDSILPRVEKARERLKKIPALVKRFRQSVLTAAVTGKLTERWREKNPGAGEWSEKTIGEVATLVTKGGSPKWQGFDYCESKEVLFVTSENVRDGFLDLSTPKYLPFAFNQTQRNSILKKGDLLLNIVGASIGRSAEFFLDDIANVNQAVAVIRILDQGLRSFLKIYLNSPVARAKYTEEAVDVARANLSLGDIKAFSLMVPTSDLEIVEIVRQVDKLFALADKLEAHYHRAMARVEKFPQAILAKAFRGELVPQDPNDEPAEKLLERIRQELEQVETAPGSPRRRLDRPKRTLEKARS